MHIIDVGNSYWALFILYTLGIISGRIAGVTWAQYIERRFALKADATSDPKIAPGKRFNYIKNEPAFWVLVSSLTGYIVYGLISFDRNTNNSVLIVVGLGLLQNLFYALQSRASNRGNDWYIVTTSVGSGVTFFVSAVYLFSKNMPLALFVPYTLSTSLGSSVGVFLSMIIEWRMRLRPDDHLDPGKESKKVLKVLL